MKKLVVCAMLLTCLAACKKDKTQEPQPAKIYWGNAIYNPASIIRDQSTYQSFPVAIGSDVITLQPKQTNGAPSKSFDQMTIWDTCYFQGVVKSAGLCYLNDITTKVKGVFLTTRKIQIAPCTWGNNKLVKGTAILNDDNSVDIEYTDSVLNSSNQVNHYKVRYTK